MASWFDLSRELRLAAATLMDTARDGHPGVIRSIVNRAYYAAYALATHRLLESGVSLPERQEGPTHRSLRRLIESSLRDLPEDRRATVANLVGQLYTMRIDADYKPSVAVDMGDARAAISLLSKVSKLL